MKKKILFFTGSRADYGLLKPLISRIKKDKRYKFLIAAGSHHFSKNLGFTLAEIKQILDLVNVNEIPAEQFHEILTDKLNLIREKIHQLQNIQHLLENLVIGEACPFKKDCDISAIV